MEKPSSCLINEDFLDAMQLGHFEFYTVVFENIDLDVTGVSHNWFSVYILCLVCCIWGSGWSAREK